MKRNPRNKPQSGFALIVTLSLMILLTVIAVGLLSLSSISLRSTGEGSAASEARNNARLAMMLALGELQTTMGTDTSVSAPASSVMTNAGRPHLTGVWQRPTDNSDPNQSAWHWTPNTGDVPDYGKKQALFKSWLVSSATVNAAEDFSLPQSKLDESEDVVALADKGVVDNNGVSPLVTADKVKVAGKKQYGKFAWSVFDESTKAAIQLGNGPAMTPGTEIASRSVANRFRADVLDSKLDGALKDPKNLISLDTAVIAAGLETKEDFRKRFHDFTTSSFGLLTDTARGGLKGDLTTLFEEGGGFPMPSGLFFNDDGSAAITPYPSAFLASAPRWSYMRDHYRKYRTLTQAGGELAYKPNGGTDLLVNTAGINAAPLYERLIPVIAKFQLVFSVVAHNAHISERVNWHNAHATAVPGLPLPLNDQYAVPHLSYDPVVTLYNPYDVSLDLTKFRMRVWDPPVAFRFSKVVTGGATTFYRPGGVWSGLGQFAHDFERDSSIRKCFTLVLTTEGANTEKSGDRLKLQPGEVRVFSTRIETGWNWGIETANAMSPKTFFDWDTKNTSKNFCNTDARTSSGIGQYGVETVPGWNFKAGLQTDHLAYGGRDAATLYDFEKAPPPNNPPDNTIGGFVSTKLTDGVKVEAKAMVERTGAKNFQVDILAGVTAGNTSFQQMNADSSNTGVKDDTLRSYSFTFANQTDPSAELSANPGLVISQTFLVGQILQKKSDFIPKTSVEGPGLKHPFAMLELSARTTKDTMTDSKPWLYNNPVVEGGVQNSTLVGLTNQSYDLRFMEMTSANGFPKGIDIDPSSNGGYFGASGSSQFGSSFVNMMHVSPAPAASLGDLIHSNLVAGSTLPRVTHALGNSRAHPLIPAAKISKNLGSPALGGGVFLDHSFLLNDSLWDKYFFSSITNYTSGKGAIDKTRSRHDVLQGVLDGTTLALNSRLSPITAPGDAKTLSDTLDGMAALPLSQQMAKYVGVSGPFNLNSTSVDAWRAVLSSLRERSINGATVRISGKAPAATSTSMNSNSFDNQGLTPFVRSSRPLADSKSTDSTRWAGFRALSDGEITTLAQSIVAEIVASGAQDQAPAFSVAEFVNRKIGSAGGVHTLAGVLQTAIDKTTLNDASDKDSKLPLLSLGDINAARKKGADTTEVMSGKTAEGSPSMITQGDLMKVLAPIATVRGDTFKIRSYGEASSADGKTVLARAWCEVVVQRVPDFVDPKDAPETRISALTSPANIKFGRRFNIVSFRWLNEKEI